MDRKVINNYCYNIVYQVLVIIIPFITTPYISRNISPAEFGLYNYSLTIVTYFMFVSSMGLHIYGQKKIAVAKSDVERHRIFVNLFVLRLIIVSICEVIYILLANRFSNTLVYILQSINLLASAFDISWYYAGIEDFKTISFRNIIVKISFVILLFLFVKGNHVLYKYIIIISIMNLIGNLSMFFKLDLSIKYLNLSFSRIKYYLKKSIVLLLPSLVLQLSSVVDKTILGFMSNMSEVGYYSQVVKLLNMFIVIVSAYGTVIFPKIVNAKYANDNKKLRQLINDSLSFVIHISLPCMVGLIAVNDFFCLWFYGDSYIGIEHYVLLGSVLILIQSISGILATQFMMATGNERKLTLFIFIGVIINISVDILLIPNFGAKGAIVASIISELTVMIFAIVNYRKKMNCNLLSTSIIKAVLSSVLLLIFLLVLKSIIHLSNLILLIIMIFSGIVCYLILCIIIGDKFIYEIIHIIKNK